MELIKISSALRCMAIIILWLSMLAIAYENQERSIAEGKLADAMQSLNLIQSASKIAKPCVTGAIYSLYEAEKAKASATATATAKASAAASATPIKIDWERFTACTPGQIMMCTRSYSWVTVTVDK